MTPEGMEYGKTSRRTTLRTHLGHQGSSFDEIDDAVRTAKNPEATRTEREKAAKVFADMEGTELYDKMMEGSSEIAVRIKGLIEIRLKKPKRSSSCLTTSRSSTSATMCNDNKKRNGNENVKRHPCGEEAQGASGSQRTAKSVETNGHTTEPKKSNQVSTARQRTIHSFDGTKQEHFMNKNIKNALTSKKSILSATLAIAATVSVFAQGNGLAGITEATSMVTSYFDPGV